MWHFVTAIHVHLNEIGERGMWFDHDRFCKPFINDAVLDEIFGDLSGKIKARYLIRKEFGLYDLKPEYDTQKKVETCIATFADDEENEKVRTGLFDLLSNVILFEEPGSDGKQFHFRIGADKTISYRHLDNEQKSKVY